MYDQEVFGSDGAMLFIDDAFTARRLRLWAACAKHGRNLARLRLSMSTHDEFGAFCAAADSYFGGVLRQQVCVALEKAIGL